MKKKTNAFKQKGNRDATAVMKKLPPRRIVEYYYFPVGEVSAREILNAVGEEFADRADIWPDINLCAVDLEADDLIFQDARDCFIDPADQDWFAENSIASQYQVSWHSGDQEAALQILRNVLTACGGRLFSDTDDFEPSYGVEDLDGLTLDK